MINLFQHQQQALDETEGKNRVAYYLDMGLGKTFVGSEKALKLNSRVNLLVCQCSKVQDWIEHMTENYAMNHCWMIYDMTKKNEFDWFMKAAMEVDNPDRICGVINYELTFRRNVLKTLTGFTLMLDESSLIQNENAKRSKFILGLKPDNVILLSGTPTGGKYENLWSQCQLLGWKISKELFWKQYIQTEWVETDGFWRQQITGYKNVDRLKMKLAEHGAVFMTTEQAGISLPKRNWIKVKTRPSPLYWKFWNDRYIAIDSANLGEFELDADFYGSNAHCERELIGDTSLTRRLYARQLCGLYNPARYEAFRDLVNSTEDRLIVFYNFTEEMERLKGIAKGLNRPVSVLSGEEKNLDAYRYESCRVYICDRQGWKHESDDSFRAWDMVRSEFLNTLKRLVNLDYENIILISHEDRSRDLTRKGGDKISSIKPNLQDKVANKVAGMVDLVARIVADDDERVLSFKTSEVIFGGGRLTVRDKEIPLTYDAFCEVYEEANQKAAGAVKRGGNTPATPAPETTDTPTTAPSRRGRKVKTETPPPADNYDPAEDAAKAACGDPDGTWTPGGGEKDDSVPVDEPATGDTPPWNDLPKCPDGERIFRQHDQNPEIPLCPSIDAGHRCHKEGGPDGCPLWDRPKAQAEEPAPKTDANPPRRTRKKREE